MIKATVKAPIRKGVAKVPVVLQLERLECGAAALAMVMAYYNKWIPLEQVRVDCGVSRDGSNASNMVKAAKRYGFEVSAYKYEPDDLKKKGEFPCIVHWNFNHFVVLDGFKGNKAYLNDPAKGRYAVPMEEFDKCFTGVCLMFRPGENFAPSGAQKSVWSFIKKRVRKLKIPIIVTTLSTIITLLIGLFTPIFNCIFYDRLLPGANPEWEKPFLLALALLYVLQLTAAYITTLVSSRIKGKMAIMGNFSYMWKVLHLPMSFFSQRMVGDIQSRQSGNAAISNTLVNVISPLLLNAVMMIFYLIMMLRYGVAMAAISLGCAAINLLITQYIAYRRVNITRVKARDEGRLAASTVSGLQMIETIKASGAEEGFFEQWAGCFASVNSITQKFTKENQVLVIIPSIVSAIASNATIFLGVCLTMKGEFTLGSITAFQGFYMSFMTPVKSLMTAGQTMQEMRTDMERIDDVMEYPDDPNTVDRECDCAEAEKLSGKIELRNITFGYSPLAEPLIKDFSMKIEKGSRVAFVGASGCGKSTLSKLITGIYSPWEGEILFDGKRITEIDRRVFTASVAVVDQDIVMFKDTIANNIKMWDNSIEDSVMIQAAKDAGIHQDIIGKEGGYQHKLIEGGKDFSGGQRQCMEIARGLAQEPSIIILDEATSALDAETEYNVVKAIENRGITCIVIAHRLSTIRVCDEIVVLDNGAVVERGTHEELMKNGGYYSELISND